MSESQVKTVQKGTLGKVMMVLDAISSAKARPRFTDLLQQLDLPRGTLHRQLTNLIEEDLVMQQADGTYEPGLRLLQLASRAWAGNSLRRTAEPILRDLQQQTGETVHLAVLNKTKVVYLDKVESQQTVRMHSQIGNASPVYCTGVGKAMLSALPDGKLDELLPKLELRRHTEHTVDNIQALRRELEVIRQQGFAEDREEHEPGIRCVAAPVIDDDGQLLCGISATAPVFRLEEDQLEQWQALLVTTAALLGQRLTSELGPRAKC